MKFLMVATAASGIAFLGTGCESTQCTDAPESAECPASVEHPNAEHPQGEHPNAEHPNAEHPQGEHPHAEHPSTSEHSEHPSKSDHPG